MIKNKTVYKDIVVALDAMGGDNAPYIVVEGSCLIAKKNKSVKFVFFGDKDIIEPLIIAKKILKNRYTITHTESSISAEEKPSNALRKGRESSMGLAIKAVKDSEADCAVSAGNTGALMALSMFILRPLEGVRRPAICSSIPTLNGWSVVLDLGANLEADTENLVQFGVMGSVFYSIYKDGVKPTVGLLNIGSEDLKGREEIRSAGIILAKSDIMDYKGFVEGDDIGKGTTEVVVTDGFTGNVALKTLEGTAKWIFNMMKEELNSSIFGKLALIIGLPMFLKIKKRANPSNYNGAILLGLNGITVKSHGGTDTLGFKSAIELAIELAERDFINQLSIELRKINFEEFKPKI